jgi:hypothetical protein
LSEVLIEHPVVVIEKLLKLGKGDEGRLLYLRKAITNGKPVYDSDKKFLTKMYLEFDKIKSESSIKHYDKFQSDHLENKTNILSKNNYDISKPTENYSNKNTQSPEIDSGLNKIQNLIGELKKSDSRLMDNLELLLISREISSQSTIDKSNSFGSFSDLSKNNNADLFELIKNNPVSKNSQLFGIKKYNILASASAGLFVFWFAGYQNMIDIGALPSVALGLSAGAALSAGIFYKLQKTSPKEL